MVKAAINFKILSSEYGSDMATKVMKRLQEIDSARNMLDIRALPQCRFEKLIGNYAEHYSIALNKKYRMIFIFENGEKADLRTVTKIKIVALCKDYH